MKAQEILDVAAEEILSDRGMPTREVALPEEAYEQMRSIHVEILPQEGLIPYAPKPEAKKLWERARRRREGSDHAGAIQDFSAALRLDPLWIECRLNRARSYFANGQVNEAEREYHRTRTLCGEIHHLERYIVAATLASIYLDLGMAEQEPSERTTYLALCDRESAIAEALSDTECAGDLADWAVAVWVLGDASRARRLWDRATKAPEAESILPHKLAKYPVLREISNVLAGMES